MHRNVGNGFLGTAAAVLAVALLVLSTPALSHAQPQADYGDAPDSYRTYFGSDGPYHTTTTDEWMSWTISPTTTTTMEADARLVDLDFDDAQPSALMRPVAVPWVRRWRYVWR